MSEHPYRLRRIELRDFKSVASADVRLGPLTVVVGANSSGKSTLLQSILALSQAVRSEISTAEFPLNGEFIRLGTFDETRNFLSDRSDSPMEIAFELVSPRRPSRLVSRHLPSRERDRLLFTWRAHLGGQGSERTETSGFARLVGLQVEVLLLRGNEDSGPLLQLTCDINEFGGPVEDGVAEVPLWVRPGVGTGRPTRFAGTQMGRSTIEASGRVVDWLGGDSAPIDAVNLTGCLPVALLRRQARFEGLAEMWWDVATDFFAEEQIRERQRIDVSGKRPRVSYSAVGVAADHIKAFVDGGEDEQVVQGRVVLASPKEAFLKSLAALRDEERRRVARSLLLMDQRQFRTRLRKQLEGEHWIDDVEFVGPPGAAGDTLWEFGSASQRAFGSVRYLGPLREAPHVLYDPGPSKQDLGVAGEYSAAVLHAQANTTVLMPTPEGPGTPRPLNAALDFWLREFGLVESARSRDQGRMGIALSVTPAGLDREVDLTSVGVGVSQVLPVILLCLLAEPGTLVVLEQPELHLHPKLQQDLADFLLACTRAGRQLVIETHSEHLVNRLRYRIAADETDETHGLIRLVFAENEGGVTSYREPAINSYGGLGDDWPAGFLDLTARESQDLVRQALAKRRRDESAADG